jgi:hypothetical protein
MMPALTSFLTASDGGLRKFLEEQGQHPAEEIEVWSGHDLALDCYRIDVACMGCERRWTLNLTHHFMYGMQREMGSASASAAYEEHILRQIIPFLKQIAGTLCFRFSLAAELAEWLTARVGEAGAKGVKYSALVAEAVDMHLCDARDVDAMLERLGFIVEFSDASVQQEAKFGRCATIEVAMIGGQIIHDPWVMLPEGHPLRKESE